MEWNMRFYTLSLGIVLWLAGCVTKHAEQKVQAEEQWKQVRGRVKLQLAAKQFEGALFEECSRTAAEALNLDPKCPEAYVLLARANLELGRPASAQRILDAAQQAGLASADLSYTLGVMLEQSGQAESALAKYSDAMARNPTHVDSLVARTECLIALDRSGEAWELLNDRPERFDDTGTVALLTAYVAMFLGREEDAAVHLADALAEVGKDPNATEELGLLLVRLRRYSEALPLLKSVHAESLKPAPGARPPTEVAWTAQSSAAQDDTVSLEAIDRAGLRLRGLAECYLALGHTALAQSVLTEYTASHHEDAMAQLLLAKAAVSNQDLATALRAIREVQEQKPEDKEVLFVRAVIDHRRGCHAEAKSGLEKLLSLHPRDLDARCLLGDVFMAEANTDAAAEQFHLALQADPDHAWARRRLHAP